MNNKKPIMTYKEAKEYFKKTKKRIKEIEAKINTKDEYYFVNQTILANGELGVKD